MKINTFSRLLVLAALVGCLLSCTKEKVSTEPIQRPSLKTFTSVTNVSNLEARKVAYSSLNGNERFQFWQGRFEVAISSGEYNEIQISKIRELANALSPEYFTNSDKKEIFKAVQLPKWIESCKNILSDYQIFDLIFSIKYEASSLLVMKANQTASGTTNQVNLVAPGDGGGNCTCALGSSYTCPYYSSIPPFISYHPCSKASSVACSESVRGCGALLDDACDGNVCPMYNS